MPLRRTPLPVVAALLALVVLVYLPGLRGGFVFDDFPNIVFNPGLHVTTLEWQRWVAAAFSSPASDLQRPLAMLTFAVNHYFTGLDPMPMKVVNLAIHALNTLLVLGLMRTILGATGLAGVSCARREWGARFCAAAWGLHPINLMPVLLVVQRMESLAHVFVFGGLWLYAVGRRRQLQAGGRGGLLVVLGLLGGTALGMLAKESAVLLPLYAFCTELFIFRFRRADGARDHRLQVLFAAVVALPGVAGLAWLLPRVSGPMAYAGRDYTLVERVLTEGRVVMDYLRWSVFPSLRELSLYHDDYLVSRGLLTPPSTLLAFVALAALALLAFWLRKRRPLSSLGISWFLAAQLLTATVIPLELVYEHRNYFASLGVCLLLADLLLLAPRPEHLRIGALVATVFVLLLAATTHLRAREWSDPYRFAASEAAKHPLSPRATYALAQTLVIMSDYRPDSPFTAPAREALEASRVLPDSGILPHAGLILLAAHTSAPQQVSWWQDMQQRLRQRPIGPQEINAIASLVRCARDGACRFPSQWMEDTFEAASRRPPHPELLHLRGDFVLNVLGSHAHALHLWREASRLDPRQFQYRMSVIKLLIAMGRDDDARAEIDALRQQGRFGQNKGHADAMEARLQAAIAARGGSQSP